MQEANSNDYAKRKFEISRIIIVALLGEKSSVVMSVAIHFLYKFVKHQCS